jgi:hypothetical protein
MMIRKTGMFLASQWMARRIGILVEKVVAEVDMVAEVDLVAEVDVVDMAVICAMMEVVFEDKIMMKIAQDPRKIEVSTRCICYRVYFI